MKIETIDAVIGEAKRFLRAAEAFKKVEAEKKERYYLNPRESGAVRRASMDLTRKLADLRQGR